MPKENWNFRPEKWFSEEVSEYMKTHDVSRTDALHGIVKEYRILKAEVKTLRADVTAWKTYAEGNKPVEPPSVSTPTPSPVESKTFIDCPHYEKEIQKPEITLQQCLSIQKFAPALCKAVNCKRFEQNKEQKPQETTASTIGGVIKH